MKRLTFFILFLLVILIFVLSINHINKIAQEENNESRVFGFDTASLTEEEKANLIIKYENDFPERYFQAYKKNPELSDFVLGYLNKTEYDNEVDLYISNLASEGLFPHFLQWDFPWAYEPYGKGVIGLDGCGPTSLSMVYIALTGDLTYNPSKMAKFSLENGYFDKLNDITLWTLMSEGSEELGLKSKELALDELIMKKYLSEEAYLILSMGPGDFTNKGHFIVIYDYNEEGFMIKDPNSRIKSDKIWPYSLIENQIRNIWAISLKEI